MPAPPLRFLNCFTCSARVPSSWRLGTLCILAQTSQGPALIDTGPGLDDYRHPPGILRMFQVVTRVRMDPDECACRRVTDLGVRAQDVRHIVLTHMHFDHCGGMADFPQASVHVNRREYEAFLDRPRQIADLAYVHRHVAHRPQLVLHEERGEHWFGLPAMRLPFEPEMWLVPLYGHTRGHCGVALRTENGWHFHVGDAGPAGLEDYAPDWLVRFVLGPHTERLRAFAAAHAEVQITTGHMWLDFFARLQPG